MRHIIFFSTPLFIIAGSILLISLNMPTPTEVGEGISKSLAESNEALVHNLTSLNGKLEYNTQLLVHISEQLEEVAKNGQ